MNLAPTPRSALATWSCSGRTRSASTIDQAQLRYAEYAWEPPAQGGERRADDEDRGGEG